jgi:transposase-like protein
LVRRPVLKLIRAFLKAGVMEDRHRFPASIIQHAIWLYLRFTQSHRDVEDLLAERGLDISYETVRRWVLKFERQQAEVRFARDSPLEGTGFEPSVPAT